MNKHLNNLAILNNLFSQEDLNFINSLDNEINLIKSQIDKQEQRKSVIFETMTYFENNLKNSRDEYVSNVYNEIKKSYILVNSNIDSLESLKEKLIEMNTTIIDLLVYIESHDDLLEQFISNQVSDFKNRISNYSFLASSVKSTVANNDLLLNSFFNGTDFKQLLIRNIPNDSSGLGDLKTSFVHSNTGFSGSSTINSSVDQKNSMDNFFDNDDSFDKFEKKYFSNLLRVSERSNKVYLPYDNIEIKSYLEQYPNEYDSCEDVINKEFILPFDYFMKHPTLARFRESYSLIRDRESKSIIEATKYSIGKMFIYELNPTIIAACKTQQQLENYLDCLDNNRLHEFKDFEIKFEISPFK